MEHLLLKAATTATDQGTFEAVISTASVDREGDIVEPSAFLKALEGWTKLGKHVPLAWNHSDVVIGHIDATSARAEGKEVVAKGWIDQATERGAEAWRLVKSGTLSFSFGYLVPDGGAVKRAGQKTGMHITELDLFEISVVPIAPANNDTRVLSFKSADDLRKQADDLEREENDRKVTDVREVMGALTDEIKKQNEFAKSVAAVEIEHAKEALLAQEMFDRDEIAGATGGLLKAVWTAAFINDLPDSAFLYVEPGGSKDGDGKTAPRSLRHFPYKDASGTVDLPHLRNALARIPQSNLSQDVKDRLTAKAQRILDNSKSIAPAPAPADVTDEGSETRSVDTLRQQAESTALEFASGGLSLKRPPMQSVVQKSEPELSLAELKQKMRDEVLIHLSGGSI